MGWCALPNHARPLPEEVKAFTEILFIHQIVTVVRLGLPGGLRSVVAESVLVRHQLLILNRGRKRAPNLRASQRIIAGLCALFMNPTRVLRSAIVLKPSTLLHLHQALAKRKYRMLFPSSADASLGRKDRRKNSSRQSLN